MMNRYTHLLVRVFVKRALVISLSMACTLLSQPLSAQVDDLAIARELAYAGKYAEADALYSLIIANDPGNTEALLGRAFTHSWNHNLKQARADFEYVLAEHPENKHALIGLGYTLAWAEEYHAAKHPFFKAQQLYPNDADVEKGLAYVYLWQQKPKVARDMFEKLHEVYPENTEYHIALAYAHLQMFETREARQLVTHALAISPDDVSALDLQKGLKKSTPLMEVDFWAGYTNTEDESTFGLRSIGLSIQATQKLRPFLMYDNTLSLDNIGFLLNKQSADTYYAGSIYTWNKKHTSRLQFGYRDFVNTSDGMVILAEHNYNFHKSITAKIGGLYSDNVTGTSAWMLYSGAHVPVSAQWAIEPMYYLTKPSTGDPFEHRITTTVQYQSRFGLEWSLGGLFGTANGVPETGSQNTFGGHTMLVLPVHKAIWLQGVLRYEHGVQGNYFIVSGGVKFRIEK